MPGLLPDIDPDGLLEFSVVYTDRALNHMSKRFTGVMQDILATLKEVYHAHTAVLVPGSGTFGMEAVARQFANKQKVLIVRNGWFSFRWSQIFDADSGLGGGAVVCVHRCAEALAVLGQAGGSKGGSVGGKLCLRHLDIGGVGRLDDIEDQITRRRNSHVTSPSALAYPDNAPLGALIGT